MRNNVKIKLKFLFEIKKYIIFLLLSLFLGLITRNISSLIPKFQNGIHF